MKPMTKEERSLLLFLETCCVDHGGRVVAIHMNDDDHDIAKRWSKETFISFARLPSWLIKKSTSSQPATYRVFFSEEAWVAAHAERRARSKRLTTELDGILLKGE